ncbi:DUF4846 domain-containing protein [Aquimarina sp. 2201CG5-10]|uniref:DUF4846 domain-containing protein n=1 Tax=Aquimarina callyspongiae TaxID=3098150 RepID=UPI002AB54E45|nr:DUF4846 domain-containing protein [Aquimarina sp. 2201CG5-10]MDY8138795.1 DUF4846 domain-containing protein [Aquimarina sp. 2201CG5-10]
MKKVIVVIIVAFVLVFIFRNTSKGKMVTNHIKGVATTIISSPDYINKEGDSISTRIIVPEGYKRVVYPSDSFQEYLRQYKLKPYGSKIINYDDSEYFAQNWHEAILEVPVPKNGLQQCADALMRIRAEYLWDRNRKSEIGFNFTSGHYCSWNKYAAGFRPKIKGNKVTFHKTTTPNPSKNNFYKYLNLIYTYAGTLSLHHELQKVPVSDVRIGDMLVKPGSPGHIEIIVDEIVNNTGQKMYVLAQGNTPAQNVCVLKNFEDTAISPWYRFEENEPIYTPSYYFDKALFIRFK